jgi:hypothetical protein
VLVEHGGEMEQLKSAWEFSTSQNNKPGPSQVMNFLRVSGLDQDFRKGSQDKL